MYRILRTGGAAVTAALVALTLGAAPASAHDGHRTQPATYTLTGDPAGSKFEGIGVDRRERTFYVSEVTGGEIHRGRVGRTTTEQWKPEGADGRFTARGITTDRAGRVYIAGGPNGIGTGRPDLWVYSPAGTLLAALRVGVPNAFLNDVAIGPDGAAYFTNSNAPQVFRVARQRGQWQAELWADGTGRIEQRPGFNLGGIVVSPDRRALIVAQGNVGRLWRFGLRSRQISEVNRGGADLVDADGLVLRGRRLIVVRNFVKRLTTLRLDRHGRSARPLRDVATDPDRVFTTAKIARGRLLLVDSKFDEAVAQPPYQVVALPLRPGRRQL
jgi:sugar lactone lactonase YvrE